MAPTQTDELDQDMTEDLLYGDVDMQLNLEDIFSDYKEASMKRKEQIS